MTRAYNTATTQQNSGGAVAPFTAGKNKIINGDMAIAQRSTSASGISTNDTYYAIDRYRTAISGTGLNITISRDTSVPNVTFSYSQKMQQLSTSATVSQFAVAQPIETSLVSGLYGKTATVSFWYRSNITGNHYIRIYTGSQTGGVDNSTAFNITTANTWQYVTITTSNFANITAIANYSFGAQLDIGIRTYQGGSSTTINANDYFQFTGFQLEAGSVATPFQTATGTVQGELAACQRYYFRTQTGTGTPYMGVTVAGSSTTTYANLIHKVTMRTTPTSVDFSAIKWQAINNSGNISTASISDATPENTLLVCTTTGATTAQMNYVIGQTTSGYIGVSAEL